MPVSPPPMTVTALPPGSSASAARASSAPSQVPTARVPGSGSTVLPTARNRWSKSRLAPSPRVTWPSPILSTVPSRAVTPSLSIDASGVAAAPVPAIRSCSRTRSTKSGRGLITVISAAFTFLASRFAAIVPA